MTVLALRTDDETMVDSMVNTLIDLGMTRGTKLQHAASLLNSGWPAGEVLKHIAAVEAKLIARRVTTARALAIVRERHG